MNMLWRFIIGFIRGRTASRVLPGETTSITMRVMPMDIDFLMHVNNGVYFSYLDHGRMDMTFRNGMYEICRKKGWYGVVAGESIKFKKSLKLFDKFTLETTAKGHDEKYFFVHHRILCKGQVMATAIIKIRFLKKAGGTVSAREMLAEFKHVPENKIEGLSEEWHGIENKYLA